MTLRRKTRLSVPMQIIVRLAGLFALIGLVVLVHWIERDGLRDTLDGHISFSDVIYFTMISATTTGFGDIVLPGIWGKLTSVVTMIIGISLFVRLAQSIFRPNKVHFSCPQCALERHDPDAVHCKACGFILKIPDDDS